MFFKTILAMLTATCILGNSLAGYVGNGLYYMNAENGTDEPNYLLDSNTENVISETNYLADESEDYNEYINEYDIADDEENESDEETPDDPYMTNYNATDDDPWYDVDTESCPYHTYESSVGYVPDDNYYFIQYRCPYCGDAYEVAITEEEYNSYTE